MADDGENFGVLQELQVHLRTARIPVQKLSTLVNEGDEKLVEQFLSENIKVEGKGADVANSQLYIACFWGIKDIAEQLLRCGIDPNKKNANTLWTPLHAAAFQEHGPIIMLLLEYGAKPDSPDAENRTPTDFASASDKIWPHFAALGCKRTTRAELVEKKVLRSIVSHSADRRRQGIEMASMDRSDPKYEFNSDPYIHAAVTGDVLADLSEASEHQSRPQLPHCSVWR